MTTLDPPTLPLPPDLLEAARSWQEAAPGIGPPPADPAPRAARRRTPLEEHIAALERAQEHLTRRAHALAHGGDPDRAREVLTRLRHVRARLTEARADLARATRTP